MDFHTSISLGESGPRSIHGIFPNLILRMAVPSKLGFTFLSRLAAWALYKSQLHLRWGGREPSLVLGGVAGQGGNNRTLLGGGGVLSANWVALHHLAG